MSAESESLTEDDVDQIVALIRALDQSDCEYLQVEIGNLKVMVSKGALTSDISSNRAAAKPSSVVPEQEATPGVGQAPNAQLEDTLPILSPMMGRFYNAPEPGAPPFVSIGQQVSVDTTVALIEVMKVFTAVRAGVEGVIVGICVNDADFVEYHDVIFRVRPQ